MIGATWTLLPLLIVGAHQPPEIRVPQRSPAVIDGRLSPGEWTGAYETDLPNESHLWLQHDGAYLYLAVWPPSTGYPSVCVTVGDTIRVLHASAALASSVYTRDGAHWTQRKPFTFALRSGDIGPAGQTAQRSYLAAERWVASNNAMSGVEHEMKWSLSLMDRHDLRLALGVYVAAGDQVAGWPSGASDGCTAAKTVQGWLRPERDLNFTQWTRLTLMN